MWQRLGGGGGAGLAYGSSPLCGTYPEVDFENCALSLIPSCCGGGLSTFSPCFSLYGVWDDAALCLAKGQKEMLRGWRIRASKRASERDENQN
jgi:hypothetical protein